MDDPLLCDPNLSQPNLNTHGFHHLSGQPTSHLLHELDNKTFMELEWVQALGMYPQATLNDIICLLNIPDLKGQFIINLVARLGWSISMIFRLRNEIHLQNKDAKIHYSLHQQGQPMHGILVQPIVPIAIEYLSKMGIKANQRLFAGNHVASMYRYLYLQKRRYRLPMVPIDSIRHIVAQSYLQKTGDVKTVLYWLTNNKPYTHPKFRALHEAATLRINAYLEDQKSLIIPIKKKTNRSNHVRVLDAINQDPELCQQFYSLWKRAKHQAGYSLPSWVGKEV